MQIFICLLPLLQINFSIWASHASTSISKVTIPVSGSANSSHSSSKYFVVTIFSFRAMPGYRPHSGTRNWPKLSLYNSNCHASNEKTSRPCLTSYLFWAALSHSQSGGNGSGGWATRPWPRPRCRKTLSPRRSSLRGSFSG